MNTQQITEFPQATEYEKKHAQIVTKAWEDEEFKQRLLADPKAVLRDYDIEVAETLNIRVVENTKNLLHIHLPAQSSPEVSEKQLQILSQYNLPISKQTDSGKKYAQIITKSWEDDSFKQRLLSQTKIVFQENGIEIFDELEVCVLDNTEDLVYFILPLKPSEELSDEQLEMVTGGVAPIIYFLVGVIVGLAAN